MPVSSGAKTVVIETSWPWLAQDTSRKHAPHGKSEGGVASETANRSLPDGAGFKCGQSTFRLARQAGHPPEGGGGAAGGGHRCLSSAWRLRRFGPADLCSRVEEPAVAPAGVRCDPVLAVGPQAPRPPSGGLVAGSQTVLLKGSAVEPVGLPWSLGQGPWGSCFPSSSPQPALLTTTFQGLF